MKWRPSSLPWPRLPARIHTSAAMFTPALASKRVNFVWVRGPRTASVCPAATLLYRLYLWKIYAACLLHHVECM